MDTEGDSVNIIDSIRTQLEGLKRTEDGSLLYRLIERGLGKRPEDNASTDEAFLTFMYTLLERYAKNRDGDPITRIKVRVIQQRITPYLMQEDESAANNDATAEPEEQAVEQTEIGAAEADTESRADAESPAEPEEPEVAKQPATKAVVADEAVAEPAVEQKDELQSAINDESESSPGNNPLEFDLELIDSDEIDRELQASGEKEPPLDITREPSPVKAEKIPKPVQGKTRPAEAKPVKPSVEKPKPAASVKKAEKVKARPKANPLPKPKPKVGEKNPLELKVGEEPKKPVKLELVEPTDLTKPHTPKQAATESDSDESYIDLGGDEPVSATPKKPSPQKQQVKKAHTPGIKVTKQVSKQQAESKQQLMPKGVVAKKPASSAPKSSDEPSQERVEKLHEAFVHKMAESITRSQEYHRMLRSQLKAIQSADNDNDFNDLKTLLMRGMEDLLKGNEALGRDLDSTSHYLKIARLDRALLKDELGRIKSNTTIDELTALQNKEAFIKQLESEISRVNRYGFSFAIAVLDIDDLKSINTNYGRDAGDEVIRCYARQILSQFRSYDLVARHKSDEFLLLFPNTQKEGALRAVEKAQKRAANLYINHKDKNIKVPTFTSVLTTYTPGDQPDTLLRRTTEALVQAQRRGRDQVVLALPTS